MKQQSPIARLHRPEHAGAPFDSIIFFQLSPALTGGAFPEAGRRQARLGSVDFREFVSKQGFHLRLRTETENRGVLFCSLGSQSMISGKLGRIVTRSAITLAFAIGIGAAATLSPAHADGPHGEWHEGHWGHWGWRGGVHVFIAEPYPYAYYAPPPPPVYAPPPPPPVVVVAPPVVVPSFGVFIGVGHH